MADELTGIASVRYAVARAAGWQWCSEHQRARWDGPGSCHTLGLHPPESDPAAPVWRLTCERLHGPMEWGDGCMAADELPEVVHHRTRREVVPGVWEVARPMRDTSWWHQWKRERRCRRKTGHCWHPEGLIDWWCCECSAETDGMPPQECVYCAAMERRR